MDPGSAWIWCASEFDAEMGSRINLCMMVLSFTREGASDGCEQWSAQPLHGGYQGWGVNRSMISHESSDRPVMKPFGSDHGPAPLALTARTWTP